MSDSSTADTADEAAWPQTHDRPKDRPCLMCKETFRSEWSGERFCSRCKGSSMWRTGVQHNV
jgi:hypothetical protein